MKYIIILMLSVVCFAEAKLEKKNGYFQINTLEDIETFKAMKKKDKKGTMHKKFVKKLPLIVIEKFVECQTFETKEKWEEFAKDLDVKLPKIDFDKHVAYVSSSDRNGVRYNHVPAIYYINGKYYAAEISHDVGYIASGVRVLKIKTFPKLK